MSEVPSRMVMAFVLVQVSPVVAQLGCPTVQLAGALQTERILQETTWHQKRHKGMKQLLWVNRQTRPVCVKYKVASVVQPQTGRSVQEQSSFPTAVDELRILCEEGQLDRALDTLLRMDRQGGLPSVDMYCFLLKACGKRKALAQAKRVRALLAKHGLESTLFLGEYMVSTLVKCGGFEDALEVFDSLPNRTVFSWTAVISGYTMFGQGQEALRMYRMMQQDGVQPNAYTFVSLLKACSSISNLEQGRHIHAEVYSHGFMTDLFVGTCLVDMYAKCGSILDSVYVFDSLPQRDVVPWTAMLTAYVDLGQAGKALQLYEEMQKEGISPNNRTFVCMLQACALLADKELHIIVDELPTKALSLEKAKAIHAETWRRGYHSDPFIGSALLSMYGKCGIIADAQDVFHGLPLRDVVSWNAMLTAFIEQGYAENAIELYGRMWEEGVSPNGRSFVSVLQACGMLAEQEGDGSLSKQTTRLKALQMARSVHADARIQGYETDVFIRSTLVSVYGKCGSVLDAENVFDQLVDRDIVTWNAMLGSYFEQGQPEKALQLYQQLQQTGMSSDVLTFVTVLQACGVLAEREDTVTVDGRPSKVKYLEVGKSIHADLRRKGYDSDVSVGNTLITMYGKCGSLTQAFEVFDGLSVRHVGSWSTIIAGFVQQGEAEKALQLYKQMQLEGVSPNYQTFVCVLQACGMLAGKDAVDGRSTKLDCLKMGKEIHHDAQKKGYDVDVYVGSTLISMYGKCGSIVGARDVFDKLSARNVVSWNAMLAAYLEHDQANEALELYEKMQQEGVSANKRTFVSILQACGLLAERGDSSTVDGQLMKTKYFEKGKAIHAEAQRKGYDTDTFVGNTLISMYGKCGSIMNAWNAFNSLSERDVVSWTALIAAYAHKGQGSKALELYLEMQDLGMGAKEMTLVCILQGCSSTGGLDCCRQVHHGLILTGNDISPLVATTIIHAYGRCASMVDAQAVFDAMQQPDVVAWTAIIAGYARQGDVSTVLRCYEKMQVDGVSPNKVTFLSLLSACSHAGVVELGVEFFDSMSRRYGIEPEIEHFVTMLDLFGRAGCFTRIETLLSTMPMQPNMSFWLSLLCASQKHGRVTLGEFAFDCAIRLEPKHPAPYVLMSNIYTDAGYMSYGKKLREMRQRERAWKIPGQTWIEHMQEVHTFVVADQKHSEDEKQQDLLLRVDLELKDEGYIPRMSHILIEGENVCEHTEKLGIAWGLSSISDVTPDDVKENIAR